MLCVRSCVLGTEGQEIHAKAGGQGDLLGSGTWSSNRPETFQHLVIGMQV